MTTLGAIAAVVLAYGLVSRRLERANVTAPMAFVAAGILLGPDVLSVVDGGLGGGPGLVFAEVALVLVLFSDASRIDLAHLRGEANLPARLLGIAMPLTIALGVAAGALLLGGLRFWEAAIVAAVLAPTDAALGQAVVSSERVPERIRQSLNVESGLNDGLSVPFLAVFVALSVEESAPGAAHWLGFAAEQVGYGALAGIVAGGAGGWLLDRSTRHGLLGGTFQQLAVLALAVLAWALAGWVGGNGFIAAFVGGLVAGRVTAACGEQLLDFTEDEGQLLNLAVFFLFGVSAIGWLEGVAWEVVLYALLSLTVVRMLPVALALAGTTCAACRSRSSAGSARAGSPRSSSRSSWSRTRGRSPGWA